MTSFSSFFPLLYIYLFKLKKLNIIYSLTHYFYYISSYILLANRRLISSFTLILTPKQRFKYFKTFKIFPQKVVRIKLEVISHWLIDKRGEFPYTIKGGFHPLQYS